MPCSGLVRMLQNRADALQKRDCENCGKNRFVRCKFLLDNGLVRVEGCEGWEP